MCTTGFNYIVNVVRDGITEVVGCHMDYNVALACADVLFSCGHDYTITTNDVVVAERRADVPVCA